jgi:hypothetical protein
MDSLEQISDEQLRLLAADVQVQLEKGTGTRPVLYLLAQQRQRAVKAIIGLVNVLPHETEIIRGYQQEAALYSDLIDHCREMLNRGREADRRIYEEERTSLHEAIDNMSDEDRQALKIEPRGED